VIAVNTDASFRDDLHLAGIAYCGALGRAGQVVDARNVMHAELLALAFAMSKAHACGVGAVTFRHDVSLSLRTPDFRYGDLEDARGLLRAMLAAHPGWRLKWVRRERNAEANVLARRALKIACGRPAQRRHCEEAERKELNQVEAA
jgi:ribonuclease HI